MSVKISEATMRQLRRFPSKEKIIAEQVLRNEVLDRMHITSDTIVMGALIVLIEEFHFGTNVNREDSRVKHFISALNDLVDFAAKRYDQAMAEAMRKRLHDLGIDYER